MAATDKTDDAAHDKNKKFRVLHGAISGVSFDRKGNVKEKDFYQGALVTADQLEGAENVAYYMALGAIEEVE